MPWKAKLALLYKTSSITWFDLAVIVCILVGGSLYLHNALHWGVAWIGNSQYGDAEFWWNGALHVAQGALKFTNSGDGYRPGYFYLTGLTLPILGQQFLHFYPYFLFAFLSATGLFYLALRLSLDRWVCACAVGMLIFNPYTAEWLATSTTDGTGLLLNLLALTCLFLGFNKKLSRKWLMLFGLLFSLETLTRPLITPFIGVVLILIFSIAQEPFKKRLNIAICVLAAFCLPTLLWMGVQKATIGQWTVSSKDASVFYAASNPTVQVWNSFMQNDVQKRAAKYYHVEFNDVNDKMLNHVFWQEAIKNYAQYPGYHLKRAILNLLEIARFSPAQATRGNGLWRLALFEAIIASLLLWLLAQRRYFNAAFFLILGFCICFFPKLIIGMVLAGTILGFTQKDKISRPGMPILSAYWLTGVVALYLVGGTWGELSFSNRFALNALGYRLGSQFFFVGDILAAYFLVRLAHFKVEASKIPVVNRWHTFISRPAPVAGGIVLTGYGALFLATTIVYFAGSTMVGYRAYSLHHPVHIESYPSLTPIIDAYEHRTGNKLYQAQASYNEILPTLTSKSDGPKDVVFTGTISPFVWNLSGQRRAQIMVYPQNNVYPYTITPYRIILDVPKHLNTADWAGKQGAFIIRNIPDDHNKSNLPYYLTVPALRAFIPIEAGRHAFALSKTSWFPLVKNATQLETSGELRTLDSQITWALNSGEMRFKRRFFVKQQHMKHLTFNKVQLKLDTSTTHGPTTLSFSYALGEPPEKIPSKTTPGNYQITISTVNNSSTKVNALISENVSPPPIGKDDFLRNVTLSIPKNTKAVEISFNNLPVGAGVWIYEFNLSATGFNQHSAKTARL